MLIEVAQLVELVRRDIQQVAQQVHVHEAACAETIAALHPIVQPVLVQPILLASTLSSFPGFFRHFVNRLA